MSVTIKLKNASGSDPSASDLVVGEVALRTDNGKLFTKKDDNSVTEIGTGILDLCFGAAVVRTRVVGTVEPIMILYKSLPCTTGMVYRCDDGGRGRGLGDLRTTSGCIGGESFIVTRTDLLEGRENFFR